jgi:hypothetical protein
MVKIIQAFFKLLAKWGVTITVPAGTGKGTTSPLPGTYTVDHGSTFTILATPEAGSTFDYWTVNGVNVGSTNPLVVSE